MTPVALRWEAQRAFLRDARRARYFGRLVAKAADLIVALALWQIPGAAGAFAALFYVLFCDAFPGGQSPGKRLARLKVVRTDREPMDFPSSALRNLTVSAPFAFHLLPVVGSFLAYVVGVPILLVETYLGFEDDDGQRAGDTLAETLVVEQREAQDAGSLPDRRA